MKTMIVAACALALAGCERAVPGATIIKNCADGGYLWRDAKGQRWLGYYNTTTWLKPVAPTAKAEDVCL